MKFGIRKLLIATAIIAVVIGFVRSAREAASEMTCRNNIKQVGVALLSYVSAYGQFPVAVELASNAAPWRSWRTRIYPTFMEQMSPFYDASSSWDSPNNMRLLNGTPVGMRTRGGAVFMRAIDRVPGVFTCPKCDVVKDPGVSYVVVRGEGTAFPDSGGIRLSDITDGVENTILVVESITCRPDWTEPVDLEFNTMEFTVDSTIGPSISSLHEDGALVCFADGAAYRLTPIVTEAELKAMLTIAGNENVQREDLVARGVLVSH